MTKSTQSRLQLRRAFTLIELIGVLAIIAILASVIVPNVASQITRSTADAEDAELNTLARALEQWVQQNRRLPSTTPGGTNGWDVVLATQLSLDPARITQSKRTGTRRLILDPGANSLPANYNQATGFFSGDSLGDLPSTQPSVRLLLVSHMDQGAPAGSVDFAQFNAVWNQNSPPTAYTESELVRIERINLSAQMYPVSINLAFDTLPNHDKPQVAVDTTTLKKLDTTATAYPTAYPTVYLFRGTHLTLARSDTTQARLIVTGPLTLTFDGRRWHW